MTFTMTGHLTDCLLLAYRVPVAAVLPLLPAGLAPVTHRGFAFWNVVACRAVDMRPRGLPAALGVSYHHVAYRLYVTATTAEGRAVSGLYFVRSDADSALVAAAGNVTTDFRFHRAAIDLSTDDATIALDVRTSNAAADASLRAARATHATLAPDSCFDSLADAHLLKYQPLALGDPRRGVVRLAEVERDEARWRETPLDVTRAAWSFFDRTRQPAPVLQRATLVDPLPYRWRLGRRERLSPD